VAKLNEYLISRQKARYYAHWHLKVYSQCSFCPKMGDIQNRQRQSGGKNLWQIVKTTGTTRKTFLISCYKLYANGIDYPLIKTCTQNATKFCFSIWILWYVNFFIFVGVVGWGWLG